MSNYSNMFIRNPCILLSTNGGNYMVNLENVTTVLLDCDETIWIHRKDETKIIANALGIPFSKEFDKQFFSMLSKVFSHSEIEKRTIEEFSKAVALHMPILREYNLSGDKFVKTWFCTETSFINEDSLELLHYLKIRNYKIVILSDLFYEKQIKLLEKYGILPYVDEIYTCDDNYLKSNPNSVSRIIPSGHESEYVIVGDSLYSDISFANTAGISSIWYNPKCKENNTEFKPTIQIRSLLEICRILK